MVYSMNQTEVARLQTYLRDKFGTERFSLHIRPNADDSVEVHLGGEFIGVIYKDTDDGDISYDFNMAILEMDLPSAA